MNYENSLAKGLVGEILDLIYKYEDSITVATAVGCLEIAKIQLLDEQVSEHDDED